MDPLQFSVCLADSLQIHLKLIGFPAPNLHHMDFAPLDVKFFEFHLYLFFLKI